MCVCMYVCECMWVGVYICMCVCMFMCVSVCVCEYMDVCVCMYVCVSVCTSICARNETEYVSMDGQFTINKQQQ